jgi:3-hydroxybutyryl-CoA dehydrogenase/5-formyl-3-hydroxy-2-methylpyridine 4-carboxylate dehydrogenase
MRIAAVVGLGTMGPGIAAAMARSGAAVRLFDASPEAVARAKTDVAAAARVLESIGKSPAAIGPITFHGDLAHAVGDAEIVVEAVPENPKIKAEVFQALERAAPPAAILASNTSGIPITRIQSGIASPHRVVGMHWSNPPQVIPVIEVIAGERTAPDVAARLAAFIRSFGYMPVPVRRDVAGFVHNRVLYALLRECVALVEHGVIDAAALDALVKWSIGLKLSVIGPMELLDVAGLDIYEAVSRYLNAQLDTTQGVAGSVSKLTAEGALGMKSGRGIYAYSPDDIARLRGERARRMVAVRKTLAES